MNRILFIGHEANHTGAPMILLHLMRWLKANAPAFHMDLLLLNGGDLEQDYRTIADTFVFPGRESQSIFRRTLRHLKMKVNEKPKLITHKLQPFKRDYEIVLGNTVVSMEYLELFKRKGLRTICWLHELEYIVASSFSEERFTELSKSVDRFIVGSKAVEVMLAGFGITEKVDLVYDFSPIDFTIAVEDAAVAKQEIGIPASAFLVGGGGTVEWRKGVDLFLQIATCLTKNDSNIYAVWIGGKSLMAESDYSRVQFDLTRLGLEGRVVFTGMRNDYRRFLSAIDLFALTSREDPFPLMCLEAASLAKPIICFEKAGGMPEFVEEDAGAVVPYGDLTSFCEQTMQFYYNRDNLRKAGQAARTKFTTRFSADRSCQAIKQILLDL